MNESKMYRGRRIVSRMNGEESRKMKEQLLQLQGRWCNLCHSPITDDKDISLDHIIPLARGGRNSITNLQIVHRECNLNKGKRLIHGNRPFQDAFEQMGLVRPRFAPRYLTVYVWSMFRARINLSNLEVEIPVERWWFGKQWAFHAITYIMRIWFAFLNEEFGYSTFIRPEDYAKISEFDKIRLERSDNTIDV